MGIAAWLGGTLAVAGATAEDKLGEVSFPVSCNAAAQAEFNRAMARFHSFWFDPAKAAVAGVLEHDPECGMAHWGVSIMSMGNPFAWAANPNASKAGAPAAAQAQRVGAGSARERDYIAALGALFANWETTEFRPRAIAFEKAMEDLANNTGAPGRRKPRATARWPATTTRGCWRRRPSATRTGPSCCRPRGSSRQTDRGIGASARWRSRDARD